MGKWYPQANLFISYRIFFKLAGNQDRHKISDEFEFQLDRISHFRVTCPWRRINFSIDLLWNLQVQLTFQMKIYWVHCRHNSSYSFPPIILKLFWCFLHGMKMCMWFGYNPLIIFISPTEGEGDILFLVRILLASALASASTSAWHFLACTISHEPVGGF